MGDTCLHIPNMFFITPLQVLALYNNHADALVKELTPDVLLSTAWLGMGSKTLERTRLMPKSVLPARPP